jgi:hypothetical protein
MSPIKTAFLAGGAALALVGLPHLAAARDAARHVLSVELPDGQIEQIQYIGDVAPQVLFVPAPMRALMPVADPFGPDSPFAMLQAMSARMDQEMSGLMHQVESLGAQPGVGPGNLTEAAFGHVPAGVTAYSVVQTITPNGVCTRTTRTTGAPGALHPRTVSQVSGDCGSQAVPTEMPAAPTPGSRPHTIEVKDVTPLPATPTWRG